VVTQVLIDPKGVERGGVEAREEHAHDDEQVDLAVLHAERHVLVVVGEFFGRSVVRGAERRVVVADGTLEEVAAGGIEALGVVAVLVAVVGVLLVGAIAEDGGNLESAVGGQGFHLSLQLHVVELGAMNVLHGQDAVEAAYPGLDALLIDALAAVGGNLGHVGQQRVGVGASLLGLLVEVFDDILRHAGDAAGVFEGLFALDVPHAGVLDVVLLLHGAHVIDAEGQHVVVADGIDDGIGVEARAEHVLGGVVDAACRRDIFGEDGRAREAEEVIALEAAHDELVHLPELRTVAFVEYHHHFALVEVALRILLHESRKLLDGGDDDFRLRVGNLPLQFACGGVAVGGALLEAVVLLHRLVVEVLAIDHEEHLVDVVEARGKLGGLERGECLARACGVPDVAACLHRAVLAGVVRHLDAVEHTFGGGYLIGAHGHEHALFGEDAVARQDAEQSVAAEEGGSEVLDVAQDLVVGVRPVAGELERVAGARLVALGGAAVLAHYALARGVGVVLGFGAVRDDEDLHILEEC